MEEFLKVFLKDVKINKIEKRISIIKSLKERGDIDRKIIWGNVIFSKYDENCEPTDPRSSVNPTQTKFKLNCSKVHHSQIP